METRTCSSCNVEKPVDQFVKGVNWRRCKECVNRQAGVRRHGSEEKAKQVAEERKFRDKMYADGYSHCATCQKWLPKEMFSVDRKRKSGCNAYCIPCQAKRKAVQDDKARPPEVKEHRVRAVELFAARQRECPLCGVVYASELPKNTHGQPRWWAAWKKCHKCQREVARNKLAAGIWKKKDNEWKKKDPVKRLYHQAKSRRHPYKCRKVVEFDVGLEYLRELWAGQEGRCALSGVEFDTSFDVSKNPYSPSLDRIDSGGGYTPGNVRFVCWALNAGMSNWGLTTYLFFAEKTLMCQAGLCD